MEIASKIVRNARIYNDILKRDGPSQAAYSLIYELINRVTPFSIYRVFSLFLANIQPRFFDLPPPFQARFLRPEEALAHATDPCNDLSMRFVEQALKNGEECFGIFDGVRLCSYAWYSERPCHARHELYFYFEKSFKYRHKAFTYRQYRGFRLNVFSKALACRHYSQSGFRGLLSIVENHNVNSLRSNYRLGQVDVGKIAVILWGNHYRTWADSRARSLGCHMATLENHG